MRFLKEKLLLMIVLLIQLIFSNCTKVKSEMISYNGKANVYKNNNLKEEYIQDDTVKTTIEMVSSPAPGSVNSFVISNEEELIVIDAMRTSEDAKILEKRIKSYKKNLIAIVITHAHPDHFGGLKYLHSVFPLAIICSSEATIDDLKTDKNGYIKSTKKFIGKSFGVNVPIPTVLINKETFAIGKFRFDIEYLNPSEAEASITLQMPDNKVIFAADLVNNNMVPYLAEGKTKAWIEQLEAHKKKYVDWVVYPGHGKSGKADVLFQNQLNYLKDIRSLIFQCLKEDNQVSWFEKRKIKKTMLKKYKYLDAVTPSNSIHSMNINAVIEEMKKEGTTIRK